MSERKAPTGTITGATMDTTWQTPPELYGLAAEYFGGRIPFDAATTDANPTNAVECATPEDDGLEMTWPDRVWVNPPYGRELKDWLGKIAFEASQGTEVIAILPAARWEQLYFQQALYLANCVTWIRKRVRFIRASTGERVSGNPYANMFVGWNVEPGRWAKTIGRAGMSQALSPLSPCPARLEARGATP